MKPPVEAPRSRQSLPAGSTPSASSACASFSPPRETNRGGRSTWSSASSATCCPGLSIAGHEPGDDERLRLGAALREPALHEQDVEPLAHCLDCRGSAASRCQAPSLSSPICAASVPVVPRDFRGLCSAFENRCQTPVVSRADRGECAPMAPQIGSAREDDRRCVRVVRPGRASPARAATNARCG